MFFNPISEHCHRIANPILRSHDNKKQGTKHCKILHKVHVFKNNDAIILYVFPDLRLQCGFAANWIASLENWKVTSEEVESFL